jgi:hypothetical protein
LYLDNFIRQNFYNAKPLVGYNVRTATENEFSFIVAITKRSWSFIPERDTISAAVLISDKDILTTEHCLYGQILNSFRIIIGSINIFSHLKYYTGWWIDKL